MEKMRTGPNADRHTREGGYPEENRCPDLSGLHPTASWMSLRGVPIHRDDVAIYWVCKTRLLRFARNDNYVGISHFLSTRHLSLCAALVLILLLSVVNIQAETPQELFGQGNRAYEAQEYKEALGFYEGVLDDGMVNGYLFFNLGNTHFMMGELGQAVLCYERAQRLIPRHEDLRVNRERVLELLEDPEFSKFRESRIPLVLRGLYNSLTLSEMAYAVALVIILGALVVEIRLLWRKGGFATFSNYLLSFSVVVVIILGATCYFKVRDEVLRDPAIVISPEVDVRSGPGEQQGVVFTIHQGTQVLVKRSRENWVQVSLPNGYTGWLPREDIESVKVARSS